MPCELVVEHIGKFFEPVGVDHPGLQALLRLIDIGVLAKALIAHAPCRMVWGSNWPYRMSTAETMPDDAQLLDLLRDWVPEKLVRHHIWVDNPAALYGFGPLQ